MPPLHVIVACSAVFMAIAAVTVGVLHAVRIGDLQELTSLLRALVSLIRVLLLIAQHLKAEEDDR